MSAALDEIRRLYYVATRHTITRDFDRAIDLLKSMPGEADRERATVYMEGLAAMRADWGLAGPARRHAARRPRRPSRQDS
ncbi:MAG: hypothetical protein ACT4QD_13210 [Acidobacteriota bacterium]